jgi:hypothetical protein
MFHAVRQVTIYISTTVLQLDTIIYKVGNFLYVSGFSTIFRDISNKKNLHGDIQQKSSGIFHQKKSSWRYSTKIFRDFSTEIFGEVFNKNLQIYSTKIRETSNKNLQRRFQQKSSGMFSTKSFSEVFNKNLLGGGGIRQRIIFVE